MRTRKWKKLGSAVLLATAGVALASWRIGQRPHITPGTHQIFYMDSTPGAMLEFLLVFVVAAVGLVSVMLAQDGQSRAAKMARRISGGVVCGYFAAVVVVSLLTPKTIVSIGDSYCWDMWCVGIQDVNGAQEGQDVRYTAQVSVFADSHSEQRVPADQAKQFFYVMDDQGNRFPILREASFANANVIVKPGESVKSTLAFVVPAKVRKLYLTGDMSAPLWVRLYLGSDLAPFHRRTLLRIL